MSAMRVRTGNGVASPRNGRDGDGRSPVWLQILSKRARSMSGRGDISTLPSVTSVDRSIWTVSVHQGKFQGMDNRIQ